MRTLLIGIVVVGMMALPAMADSVFGDPYMDGGVKSSVGLEVSIVPWVSIQLDLDTLVINIPAGEQEGSAYVGGSVTSNVGVTLSATIETYPVMPDATGKDRSVHATWNAKISEPMRIIPAGTTLVDDDMLTVSVAGISRQVIAGNLTGGIVTITIMPAQ